MSKDDNDEVLAMARAFHEGIKDAEELYQALKAENERLREALGDLLDNCSEQAFGHKQAVARVKQLLGIPDRVPFVLASNKNNDDFDEYVIETVTTGGEK